jgi:membrane-bound lytic murein transglycosylase B
MFDLPATGPLLRQLLAGTSLALLTACAEHQPEAAINATSAQPPTIAPAIAATVDSPAPAPQPAEQSFDDWRKGFRQQALAAGIQPQVFDAAFAGVSPDPSVVAADRSQPEFTRPVWEYLDGALSSQRVAKGQVLLKEHATTLHGIEQRYGVDRQTLVAIWGLESNYGQIMGNKSVIRSLATLAHEGRRPDFARSELLAALQILQSGDVQPGRMLGSWAGAMGQTQFIPSTYNRYAVDFDRDGKRDVWTSPADALASAANYLQASGWRTAEPWGIQVALPTDFDYALADTDIRKPIREWQTLGIKAVIPLELLEEPAALLLPAGYRGPAFLVLNNFRAILKYNNSSSYAMAVGLLGERFLGRGQILGTWPTEDLPLSRSERIEMQELLAAQGFDPGAADGIIGANTRRAIRGFQQVLRWPADGYPTQALLQKLRTAR